VGGCGGDRAEAWLRAEHAAGLGAARVDVCDVGALQASIGAAADALGGLDGLINNVANDQRHTVAEMDEGRWRANLAVNLDPAFFAAQAAHPHLRAAGGGAILNIGSITALLGPANMAAYVTARAGLMGNDQSLGA
jgi:NAD(P)-dependent dehydrogenase (short-subunit alcohol dehydrogenase family)